MTSAPPVIKGRICLRYIVSVVVAALWPTSRAIFSIGTPASDISETKLCRSSRGDAPPTEWVGAPTIVHLGPRMTPQIVWHSRLNLRWDVVRLLEDWTTSEYGAVLGTPGDTRRFRVWCPGGAELIGI